jgi:LuxR family transcriptional regulator, regulator of acetate metabolism
MRGVQRSPDDSVYVRIVGALADAGLTVDATRHVSVREALDEALLVTESEIDALAMGTLADLCQRLVWLHDLRDELAEQQLQRRLHTHTRVHDLLSKLRSASSVDAIVAGAPQAVCEACDFDRAAVYRVRGSDMLCEAIYVRDDPDTAFEFLEFSRENPGPLQDQILESEMARRRIPLLVRDSMHHPSTFKPLIEHYQTFSYVCAPIMPEGRVIGFIHADKGLQHPHDPNGVDEFDRDVLWAFAEGLGYAIERAHLVERLRSQAEKVDSLMAQMRAVIAEYLDTKVELVSDPHDVTTATRTATAIFAGPESPLERMLSRRELEVLELVAQGATNAQIATKLFITEGTAKAHVGHILRKLGAGNRVEATTLYLRARDS